MVSFGSDADMQSAMVQGETDACLTGSAVPAGYRALVSLPLLSSYMMLRAEDTALASRIDSAIRLLKTDDPHYISNLYRFYVASRNTEMTPLTAEARSYLAENPELSVAVVRDTEPFVHQEEDGTTGGIIPDYYAALSAQLHVSFRFVTYDTMEEAIAAVAGGETDILGSYCGDIIIADRENLYDTMEYGSGDCARISKSSSGGPIQTAAVVSHSGTLLKEQLDPEIRLISYPNAEACYQAVMRGETDAMIGFMSSITWLVNRHSMRSLSLSVLPNVTLGIRGAVSSDNQTLLFLLNKAIAVSGNAMSEAILQNAVNTKTDLRTALERLPSGIVIAIVAVLTTLVLLLIITLILLILSTRARMALLRREMNIDGLTGAGSRRYGKELLKRELQLFNRFWDGPLIAMFDIDHFKQKNDNYGHEYGDFVLKKVVSVLSGTLRQSDSIIRWGGDEFILIFPRIQREDADHVLSKVLEAINRSDYQMDGKGERITISIGASFFRPGEEDISPALRRCDAALYEAKEIRNTYRIYLGNMPAQNK